MEVNIAETLARLLKQEDTDGDTKITVEDHGPKLFKVEGPDGDFYEVKGTYHLSNLLQELVIAQNKGRATLKVDPATIEEEPVNRVSRMIREYYWDGLTRTMDSHGIEALLADTKNETIAGSILTVYVPFTDALAHEYYNKLAETLPLKVVRLPEAITPEYVRSLNDQSGILSLKLSKKNGEVVGEPFVVPGGRFNEMYGWDSYFESIGLLLDGRTDLAQAMANNFQYEIEHYGKILNANRSYYLTRTQPPFYSSLVSEVFEKTSDINWLKDHLKTAIKEYETVWMVEGKRKTSNGLNRYLAEGLGKPPEAEAGHFTHVFASFASEVNMETSEYEALYSEGKIENEALDKYFLHDRTVRENGHDTSYRLEGVCAHLNVVELNAFLYKYETDFSFLISNYFGNSFVAGDRTYTSEYWDQKAAERKKHVDDLLWNDEVGMYFDFNFRKNQQTNFVSATVFTPLWAKLCSQEQAEKVVKKAMPLLLEKGGIVSCTKESRGEISKSRPQKQWDYPNGWAPHQMMIWKGLQNYGFEEEMQEIAYRWLFMITKNAVDYNGTIPEKYDVVSATHKVFAEYGNVGTEFQYITTEGFGWMNASYQYGLSLLKPSLKKELNNLVPPKELFS